VRVKAQVTLTAAIIPNMAVTSGTERPPRVAKAGGG
jgi:hypothetical protein